MKDRTNMFNRSKSSSMLMKVFVSVATVSLLSGTVECFSPGWGATRDALAVQTYGQNDGQGIVDPQWTGLDRTAKASRHSLTLSMSSPSASGSEPKKPSSTSSTTRRPKKTLQDRTEEETRSLIQDLVKLPSRLVHEQVQRGHWRPTLPCPKPFRISCHNPARHQNPSRHLWHSGNSLNGSEQRTSNSVSSLRPVRRSFRMNTLSNSKSALTRRNLWSGTSLSV